MQKQITLGGGCFWCLDAIFKTVKGVTKIESGYAGGEKPNPTYLEVCGGKTGHAEVVRLTYDEDQIKLEDIIRIFFEIHDATTMNKQGADVGTQYRSVIFYENETEKGTIEKIRDEAQKSLKDPIVTEITSLSDFFLAEEYHQDYYAKNPNQPYCTAVISPKLSKFLKK